MSINRLFLTIIVLITVIVSIIVFVMPKYTEFIAVQKSLDDKQAEYETKSIYYAKIATLIEKIESKKEGLEKVNSALPEEFSYAPSIYFLQAKGAGAGLLVKSIGFAVNNDGTETQSDLEELESTTVNLNLQGSYQNLKNFIASLEKSARLLQVTSISFRSGSSLGGPASVSLPSNPSLPQPVLSAGDSNAMYNFDVVVKMNTY